MGKVRQALAVAALALGFLTAPQLLADEAADLEAVERELETEAMALELYERARKRAEKAVQASSLGREYKKLSDASSKAMDKYDLALNEASEVQNLANEAWDVARDAERRAESESLLEVIKEVEAKASVNIFDARIRIMSEWRENDQTRPLAQALSKEASELREAAAPLYDDYRALSDKRETVHDRMYALIRRMTLKFLTDEIAEAVAQGLDDLERELRELEKKARKGVTI